MRNWIVHPDILQILPNAVLCQQNNQNLGDQGMFSRFGMSCKINWIIHPDILQNLLPNAVLYQQNNQNLGDQGTFKIRNELQN